MALRQEMLPGKLVSRCGDALTVRLHGVPSGAKAYFRTNCGMVAAHRAELIAAMEDNAPVIGRDWHDLAMLDRGNGVFELVMPLTEVGVFSGKCYIVRDKGIEWANGDNMNFKVGAAENIAGNLIYCAFVRQFGKNKNRAARDRANDGEFARMDAEGHTAIPSSGTFRDLIRELDFIFFTLGSRIIQLLPVHPTPVSFGRMGRFGSPFAATDYFNVDPALAEFDPTATPMEQFAELIDAVHFRRGRVFMDIPVNHTGWASRLQTEHPEMFVRDEAGRFVSPGAWGVVWEDLCRLDYSRDDTIKLMAKVFLFWCRRGVDGFRCDAGYMLPARAWNYIVAKVKREYPDTVFLLEGLGGPYEVQTRLLGECGLDWAYSEVFQYYDRGALEHYYNTVAPSNRNSGLLLNMAETHDNSRLAAVSAQWARLRLVVAAALSDSGTFGFSNGVEWLATEQIDVHQDCALNWGAQANLVEFIAKLQRILRENSCFYCGASRRFVHRSAGNSLAVWREQADDGDKLLILINLDCNAPTTVSWHKVGLGGEVAELISGDKHTIEDGGSYDLEPGGFAIFSPGAELTAGGFEPMLGVVNQQRSRALAVRLYAHFRPGESMAFTADELGEKLRRSPDELIRELSGLAVGGAVHIELPSDARREIVAFPGSVLLVSAEHLFRVRLLCGGEVVSSGVSVVLEGGREAVALFVPRADAEAPKALELIAAIATPGQMTRVSTAIRVVPTHADIVLPLAFSRDAGFDFDRYSLLANRRGGYSMVSAAWGALNSKYDALLAANCDAAVPVDRQVMFTRCRAWLVFRGYSFALDSSCLVDWSLEPGVRTVWRFSVPVGQGMSICVGITLEMAHTGNAVRLVLERIGTPVDALGDSAALPVKVILRPDIEDRVNHCVTKALNGAERDFPRSVTARANGFAFNPYGRKLDIELAGGVFVPQSEWQYMVQLPAEAYYGLEDRTDLFSPGYFECRLNSDDSAVLTASVTTKGDSEALQWQSPAADTDTAALTLPEAMRRGMKLFTVQRNGLATVLAGYPWFLDWGRDTLICLRGMIAAGYMTEAEAIIRNFATFEDRGTIPNMINGNDTSNRDTVDAPLWLIVAVESYVNAVGDRDILSADCGGRKLIDTLVSIVEHYLAGTPNGIKADSESMLVFAPPHYTWMDTNYPMGTPRGGYPVEIQALWFRALSFLAAMNAEYAAAAERVRASVLRLYRLESGGLADCLHCAAGTPAAAAVADNAVRPNQLLAVTLGVVDDIATQCGIVRECEKLVIPGAIRTLAAAAVEPPLPIFHNGTLLNDPSHPYWGRYAGAEDTSRKPAYHNGTAWCWPFPLFIEALHLIGGGAVTDICRGYLNSAWSPALTGVPWLLPEVADGDAPHRWGGCAAQAWSVTEFYRVWRLIGGESAGG